MGNFDVEKTIVVPDSGGSGNNFLAGMLASAYQSKGLDVNAVMALCGNRNGSFGNGWDGIIALIVIAAIFGGNGNGLFVSCNRDAVNAEVAAYMHNSEVAIADDVINAHRQIIESCKNIMVVLNPEIAERQRLEKENSELKTQLKELYKSQSEMKDMMASLLEQLGSPVKKS